MIAEAPTDQRRTEEPPRRSSCARAPGRDGGGRIDYDQATVDRLCRAVAWATANEQTFGRLTRMSVDESGMGSADGVPARRWKILGILRDALRTRSVGIIEELPDKGIVKYAKPAGVIAGLLPVTNPLVTMVNMAINAIKCRDAVIFSPHPLSRKTALEIVRVLRAALKKQGAPEDLILCLEKPSIPLAQELMSICDLTIATGGTAMVKAAYSSGKPAYGVGAGNATVVIDETADLADAAMNTRISKTQNHGSGCSCDGNLLVEATVYDGFLEHLQSEGGYLATREEKCQLEAAMWDADGRRTLDTVARAAGVIAEKAGFQLPEGKSFIIVKEDKIGKAHRFSGEKLSPGAGHLQVQRLRRRARRWSRRSSKWAARATRSGSPRSTTITFTGWRRWRRSAASWCGSPTCAAMPDRSPTACR